MKLYRIHNAGTILRDAFQTRADAIAFAEVNTFGQYSIVKLESLDGETLERKVYGQKWVDNSRTATDYDNVPKRKVHIRI